MTLALGAAVRLRSALRAGVPVRIAGVKPRAKVKATLVLPAAAARRAGLTRGKRAVTIAAGSARADGKARQPFACASRRRPADTSPAPAS